MVTVILDACKKILSEYGESAFNVIVLEKVSGVCKGSIYQYFPNLDAIVAALFEREFNEFIKWGTSTAEHVQRQGLQPLLYFMVENAVRWHESVSNLHSSFYDQYKLVYDVGTRFIELSEVEAFCRDTMVPAIANEYPGHPLKTQYETAHLAVQLINSLFFSALRYYPEKINQRKFHDQLVKTTMTFITSALKQ